MFVLMMSGSVFLSVESGVAMHTTSGAVFSTAWLWKWLKPRIGLLVSRNLDMSDLPSNQVWLQAWLGLQTPSGICARGDLPKVC